MKYFLSIFFVTTSFLSLTAQDIKNTLGTNGSFVIEDENNASLLNVSSTDGSVTLNNLVGTDTSNLQVDATGKIVRGNTSGGLVLSINEFNTPTYTASISDYTMIPIADCTITVPDASTSIGRIYVVKLAGISSTVNITSADINDRFDGSLSIQLNAQWEFVQIQAVTTEAWIVIGGSGYTLIN